jgi:hypothetical protein
MWYKLTPKAGCLICFAAMGISAFNSRWESLVIASSLLIVYAIMVKIT